MTAQPPPPAPPRPGYRPLMVGLGLLAVVLLIAIVVVLIAQTGSDSATPTVAPTTSTSSTVATTTSAPATTMPPSTAPATVVLPDAGQVYNQPVAGAVALLEAAGLFVETDGIGCSNSTDPGDVRRVTVGSDPAVGIIYGKPTDSFDPPAGEGLLPGDLVTVWTPSARPCP